MIENDIRELLSDLTLLFEDPRLPSATLAERVSKYAEHQRRQEAALLAETGVAHPGHKTVNAVPHAAYRKAMNEWMTRKNIVGRLFYVVRRVNET